MSKTAGRKPCESRVRVGARTVVVARVAHIEQKRPGHESEEDATPRVLRAAARADGDHVEDVRAARDRKSTLNEPFAAAVVEAIVAAEFASVFVAATWTVPGCAAAGCTSCD
jgi:hypothetical protein